MAKSVNRVQDQKLAAENQPFTRGESSAHGEIPCAPLPPPWAGTGARIKTDSFLVGVRRAAGKGEAMLR
jgi:hypothetical protein